MYNHPSQHAVYTTRSGWQIRIHVQIENNNIPSAATSIFSRPYLVQSRLCYSYSIAFVCRRHMSVVYTECIVAKRIDNNCTTFDVLGNRQR